MTMNEPAFVPPYLTLKEAAEYLERATGKAWNPSMLMGFCAQQNIPVNAAVPRDARAVQCEITNYVPELTIRPVKLPPLTIKGRTHAHYWLATWRMAVAYPETIAHVWQTGRGEVAHGVPTARDHEPCMVLFVNDKHEPVTHEVTAAGLRVSRDTLEDILSAWKRQRAAIAAELAAIPADTLAAVRATADALALHHAEQARRNVELLHAGWGRQSPPEPARAAEAPAHAPSASASPAARPEAGAAPAAPEAPDSASAPAGGLPEAVAVPAESVRVRTPTVQQVIAPYVAKLMKEHPEYTADALYRHMRREAGGDGSPFAKLVTGGELFCIEASGPCGPSSATRALTAYRKSIGRPHAPR